MADFGFFHLSWLAWLGLGLGLTHLTILSVTLYLHRGCAHRAIEFHPALTAFFRVWLWLSTGMSSTEWTAVHRKHHARCETPEDPHSPQQRGLLTVLLKGVWLYKKEAKNPETVARYAKDAPKDALEAFIIKYSWHGMVLMLLVECALIGPGKGLALWAMQLLWIPIWAAGVINGIGHFWGYRNHDCDDASRNILPWGIFIGGEELHNNHHAFPASAKLSCKPWEFDWGWAVLRALQALRLAKPLRIMPQVQLNRGKPEISLATLQAVVASRFETLRDARRDLTPWIKGQLRLAPKAAGFSEAKFIQWFFRMPALGTQSVPAFEAILSDSPALTRARKMIDDLCSLWRQASLSSHDALEVLRAWCHEAESSGIEHFHKLSLTLRRYQLRASPLAM